MMNDDFESFVDYPGAVKHFHALMAQLISRNDGGWWESQNGYSVKFSEDPGLYPDRVRGRWAVHVKEMMKWDIRGLFQRDFAEGEAWIEAYEQPDGSTRVIFEDGDLQHRPFWEDAPDPGLFEAFQEFIMFVTSQFPGQRAGSTAPADHSDEEDRPRHGHPPLGREELIYRLAKAQEAVETKGQDPRSTWPEIAREIGWDRGGTFESSISLLQDARKRLRRLEVSDPKGLLDAVAEYRKGNIEF